MSTKYVVWTRSIEDNPFSGLVWQRKSFPVTQQDAENYVTLLKKKNHSNMLVFRIEREGNEPEKVETTTGLGDTSEKKK